MKPHFLPAFLGFLLPLIGTASAQLSWTPGGADASGAWTDTTFNGQTINANTIFDINGSETKTVTTSGVINSTALTVSNTGATTLSGSAVGGTLNKTNAGALTLSSANTFGDVTISGGKFILNNAAALGTTGTLNVNAGAASGVVGSYGPANFFFDAGSAAWDSLDTNNTFSKNIAFGTVATNTTYGMAMRVGSALAPRTTTLSGNLTGASNVSIWLDVSSTSTPNPSTWILSGNNSGYAGNIRLNRGNIQFNSAASMGTGEIFIQTNGNDGVTSGIPSQLTFGFSGTSANAITMRNGSSGTNGNGVSIDTGANNVTLSNRLTLSGGSGGGTFNKHGAGTLAITGVLDTQLRSAGTATATSPITQGATSGGNVSANLRAGTFDISGMTDATATFNGFSGVAASTMALGAKNLTVSSGSFAGTLSGIGGTLTKAGTGELTLSGNNTFTGGTTFNNGTIRVSTNDTALGAGAIAVTSATVDTDVSVLLATASGGGARNLANNISITNNGTGATTLRVDGGWADLTLSGNISGNGNLTQASSGTVNLTGANTYTGATTITATSSLRVDGTGSLGAGSYSGDIVLTEIGSVLDFASSTNQTLSGEISGAGRLVKSGSSSLTITGASNSLVGTTTVSAGALFINGNLGTSDVSIDIGATIGGTGTLDGSLVFDGGSFLDILDLNNALVVNGAISFATAGFGIDNLTSGGLAIDWDMIANGNYDLLAGDGSLITTNLDNLGAENAFDIGGGREAYFQSGSLQLVVIPEPSAALLGGLGALVLLRRRRA